MATVPVDLIVLAIQAGIKLIQTGRKIYVEDTLAGEVVVPLPTAFQENALNMAKNYAQSLDESADPQKNDRYNKLYLGAIGKLRSARESDKADGEWLLIHQYLADIADGLVEQLIPATSGLASIAVIKQWQNGKTPFPSAVQRVAGALVEVAITYFLNVPGALNDESKEGKVVKAFLQGIADVDFQENRWDSISIALFTTALDTFKDHPEMVTDEADKQSLVSQIMSGVSKDVTEKLSSLTVGDLEAEDRLKGFGQIVLRSLLKNGCSTVIDSPASFGVGRDGAVLVQSVGSAFLAMLLDDGNPLSEGLKRVASTEGFDRLIHAALKAATEHPDIFASGDKGLDEWLKGVLADLYAHKSFLDPDLFVDIARSVLENGVRDLPQLLKRMGDNSALLVEVVKKVFDVLSVPVTEENKLGLKFALSRSDIKDLFSGVSVAIAAHTAWLSSHPDVQVATTTIVPLLIDVLGGSSKVDLKALVRSGELAQVLAAVLASEIIKPDNLPDKEVIVKGIDAVVDSVWADGIAGLERLLDESVLRDLLAAMARSGAAQRLFGGDSAEIDAVCTVLLPIIAELRLGKVLTVGQMAKSLGQNS